MKQHLLEAESILVELGGRKLLSDVCLQCRTGEVVGLVGRNGTGKSTLFKVIFGSMDVADRIIRIDGKNLSPPEARGTWIAHLPQHSFLPENLSIPRAVRMYVPDARLAGRLLASERLRPHLRKKCRDLSGGELRWLELLLLLHLPAPFLLLDEPFAGVEPIYRERVMDLIGECRGRKGFIITDHVYRPVLEISSRLVFLENGRVTGVRDAGELEMKGYLPVGVLGQAGKAGAAAEPVVAFAADKQTWKDLDLFDHGRRGPVFELFNKVRTVGGGDALERLLKSPSNQVGILEARRDIVRFFADSGVDWRVDRVQIKGIEHYLGCGIHLFPGAYLDVALYTLRNQLRPSSNYYTLTVGVSTTAGVLRYLIQLGQEWMDSGCPEALVSMVLEMVELLFDSRVKALLFGPERPLTMMETARCDRFFRGPGMGALRRVLEILYEWDAYMAVARVAAENEFSFPHYSPAHSPQVRAQGLFHPLLQKPVANDFQMGGAVNCCFISGANMAGKSTFLKSMGLGVYLSHVGFPVPARFWETTLFNGLMTTVNLADNISQGYSHFYSEVRRVKEVLEKMGEKQKMVVIFDELFRGTNVKDASDASLRVIDGLAGTEGSLFLISTHIVEIAAELLPNASVFFACFESRMEGGVPWYSYRLRDGISNERMGMQILKNEGILTMLNNLRKLGDYT